MAANDAELLLKVGLDLGHFRGQLNRLSSELAGQPINLNVKFNRSGIASELNLLQRQLGNKTFRVEVASNLKAEIENADKLVKALGRVQAAATGAKGSLPIGTSQLGRTAGQGGFTAAQIKTLFSAAVKGGLLDERTLGRTRAQMVAALGSIGRDSIEGLLNGLNSGDAKLQAAARSLGDSLISALKDALGIASPSKETGKLGKFAAEGFEKGFVSGMVKAERQMAQAIRFAVVSAIREGLSNLPGLGNALVGFERQLAASVQLAVRKAMREGMAASIGPGIKGGLLGGAGGAATGAAVGGAKALGGGIAGGVAKLTAGGLMGTAANLARYSLDSSAYQEFVGKLYQEIINSALSSGTQGAIIGALAVGGVAGGVGFARGATGSLAIQAITAIRNRILAALLAVSTGNLNNIVEVMVRDVTGAIFQKTIRQLRAANAQLPSINWPAMAPAPTGVTTTPTMALAPGAIPAALPGTTFGAQKRLIGDILDPSLKEILRNAANAFVDTVRQGMNEAVRSVMVRDLGNATRPMLAGGRLAGLLGAGVGRTPSPYAATGAGGGLESRAEMLARREREARRRSDLRAMDVMGGGAGRTPSPYSYTYRPISSAIVPYAPGGAMVPSGGGPSGPGGGGGTGGGGGGRRGGGGGGGGMFGGLPNINLPGSGAIRELGQEFAFATKQVLLFGQAYKLLAFVQAFPGQVSQAVSQLQNFRNTLNAISPSAAEAAQSNEFILSIVDKYNVPLQSARDGFTKLYASMAPAGFRGDEIRGLFESISMGAATFGMSADKVDRVIYAFAQMASKGQVMSEELKGQLGDVLPGAMALFAEAAGFKGPDALTKFSAALEDGAYKGENMVKLLKNVRVVMAQEFGPGAEGAAKTFQGGMNRMQNSLRQLYEAFEPAAVAFMNQVVRPLTDGIRIAADGFNAFFSGNQARTAQGAAFAAELERLRPAFEGIGRNLQQLLPTFQMFGSILMNIGKLLAIIAGNPISGFLLKVYANVLLVNTVFNLLGGKILVGLIANIGAAISRFIALNIQMAALQRTSAVANSTLAGTQLQMALLTRNATTALGPINMLKTALLGLARIGIIAIAIQVVIDGLAELDRLKKSLNDIAGFSSKEYKKQVQGLSREEVNSRIIVNRRAQAQARKELKQFGGVIGGAKALTTGRDEELRSRLVQYQIQEAVLQGARGNKTQAQLMQAQAGGAMAPIAGGGEGGGKAKGKKSADDAKRLAEEIARQAAAASDALFSEQQRLLVLQQTNPIAKAFAQYTSQELTIQRELNQALKEAKSEKEKADLSETARLKQSANALELEQEMVRAREEALRPIEDLLKAQREELQYNADIQSLMAEGMLPERAKQVAEVRKLVRAQLESLDLSIKSARAAIAEAEARKMSPDAVKRLREELEKLEKARGDIESRGKQAEAGVPAQQAKTPMDYLKEGAASAQEELSKLNNWGYQVVEGAKAIGSAFGTAFKDMISGSKSAQEALASMMQSIADHFLDMAAQIIAQQITMMIYGIILKALGIGAGFSYSGPDYSGAFGSAGPNFNPGAFNMPKLAANGAVWQGGFQAFANGGVVQGPTLGLVGEGKYNEAIVPLPDGRSIPVQLQDSSIRDKMGDSSASMAAMPMLSMSFQTTTINGVEYVDRAQLEAAMAETRRISVREGATRGATIALDKLANSPSSRRRVGLR